MAVHAVEPRSHPAATRLQKADPHLWEPLAHSAPDNAEARQHHLHRVRNDMPLGAGLKAIHPHLRHPASRSLVETEGKVELLYLRPKGIVVGMVQHTPFVRIRS